MYCNCRAWVLFSSLVLVVALPPAAASEQEPAAPDTRIVLRISREFIRKHLMPTIDDTRPVDRFLFGAHVTGESFTSGKTSLLMDVNDKDAVFTVRFTGTTVTKTQSQRRPVTVFSTSQTSFVAHRQIRFDGLKFFEEPAAIDATISSTIDCVATPRGLIGRIVRNRAVPIIEANRPEGDAISLDDAKKLVLASFNQETNRLVTDLNQIVPVEKTIAVFIPKTKDWINHLGSTREFLMVSPGPKDASIPILPKEYMRMKAPVELWVHGSSQGESTRRALEIWSAVHSGLDRFRKKAPEGGRKVEGLKFTAVGEWWVVKVGEDLVLDLLEGNDEPAKN